MIFLITLVVAGLVGLVYGYTYLFRIDNQKHLHENGKAKVEVEGRGDKDTEGVVNIDESPLIEEELAPNDVMPKIGYDLEVGEEEEEEKEEAEIGSGFVIRHSP